LNAFLIFRYVVSCSSNPIALDFITLIQCHEDHKLRNYKWVLYYRIQYIC
jgi:hypothetical protein